MAKVLKITPLDPLFFRSPMPFTAGEQDWAKSEHLPLLGTLYGAIRSAILTRRNFSQFVEGNGYPDIGTPYRKGSLKLRTFFIAKEANNSLKFYYPVPATILFKEKKSVAISMPANLPNILTDLPKNEGGKIANFFYLREDDYEPGTWRWIEHDALRCYLMGSKPDVGSFAENDALFKAEPKIGIARDRSTKASEVGKLYRAEHYRYLEGVSLIALVEGTDEPFNGVFTLGGERRTAVIEELTINPVEEFDTPTDGTCFLVYLMTPAIFRTGWYPSGVIEELITRGIKLRLITAAIPGYRIISGWDIQKKAPKTLYRAVPEGSIFVFEVIKGSLEEAIRAFHGKNISDINPEEGYGFALTGTL